MLSDLSPWEIHENVLHGSCMKSIFMQGLKKTVTVKRPFM